MSVDEHSWTFGVVKYWLIDSDLLACQVLPFGLVVIESLKTTGTFPRPERVHHVLNTMGDWKTFCFGGHHKTWMFPQCSRCFFPPFDFCLVKKKLCGGNSMFFSIFTPMLGGNDPIWLTHIFQLRWNHHRRSHQGDYNQGDRETHRSFAEKPPGCRFYNVFF